MKTALQIVGGAVAAVVLALVLLLVGARFSDGPLAIVAGGPFTSGERVTGPEPDWSFLEDVQEVEFQLLEPARSRTTWVLVHDGRVYIPSGYMNSLVGRLWKHWPYEAEEDGRAILRVDGRLYERRLVRVTEGPAIEPLLAELSRKYLDGAEIPRELVASGDLWLFELAPRR